MILNHGGFPILTGAAVVCFFMAAIWVVALRLKRFSIVDPAWVFCLVILAVAACMTGDQTEMRGKLIVIMVALWGGRLAKHLVQRLFREKGEDPRYIKLRAQWSRHLNLKFFFFFQIQALAAVLLSLPFWFFASNSSPWFSEIERVGLFIWMIGMIGESRADLQLKKFKEDPANKGRVCDVGLWSVSRHPNYFFEWLMWVGYAVMALPADYGWVGFLSPALMLYFLLFVSGVPPAEEQSLKSKGEAYRRYQQTTSVFIPWPKKK